MMDCSAYKELSGLRLEDLSSDEASSLHDHLHSCELCRSEQLADEDLLSLVDRLPTLESEITAADVRRMDGLDTALTAPLAARTAPVRSWVPVVLALAATVVLTVLIVPSRFAPRDVQDGQRFKGASAEDVVPASLDLQFSVEQEIAGSPAITPGIRGSQIDGTQGILFGVQMSGDGQLTIAEIAPDGVTQLVMPSDGVTWTLGDSGVWTLTTTNGQQLSYRPDGPPGRYVYVALMTAPAARSPQPGDIQALRLGQDVQGVDVLASDEFALQWVAGD